MTESIHPQTVIGHVHLKVSNLERAVTFYRDALGFEVMQIYGDSAAFLSAGGYHHHIGLNTWESADGTPPPPDARGCITSPSSIRIARSWRARSSACSITACTWMARPITA